MRRAWDTMYQIELSHIPFPDNPPIIYPDAPVWEELSKRRKARYASVDLKSQGEAESRIYGALREPLRSPLEYIEHAAQQRSWRSFQRNTTFRSSSTTRRWKRLRQAPTPR